MRDTGLPCDRNLESLVFGFTIYQQCYIKRFFGLFFLHLPRFLMFLVADFISISSLNLRSTSFSSASFHAFSSNRITQTAVTVCQESAVKVHKLNKQPSTQKFVWCWCDVTLNKLRGTKVRCQPLKTHQKAFSSAGTVNRDKTGVPFLFPLRSSIEKTSVFPIDEICMFLHCSCILCHCMFDIKLSIFSCCANQTFGVSGVGFPLTFAGLRPCGQ